MFKIKLCKYDIINKYIITMFIHKVLIMHISTNNSYNMKSLVKKAKLCSKFLIPILKEKFTESVLDYFTVNGEKV